ncbi:unnamed protein product [Peronospora destructor]|uniref:Uncharacterized protein n=1 Tax=Peronospora destructor TaxID=86335 RepID=A0AAV0V962_9STRA|nr:unnamed protein product [Peronospora destructor]
MTKGLRAPTSSTSNLSTIDVAPSSAAPSSSCASPIASSTSNLTPLDITFDSKQFGALVSILDETLNVEDLKSNVLKSEDHLVEQSVTTRPSVLDDMIWFHMNHL